LVSAGPAASLFLAIAAIIVLSRLFGWIAVRLRQPSVIGEILAGVLVGNNVFGDRVEGLLFGVEIRSPLAALANVGLAFFMFLVGSRTGGSVDRGKTSTTLSVALWGVAVSLVLGSLLGWHLSLARHPAHQAGFILFVAVAISVTALPVLARLLEDLGMQDSDVGRLAASSAGVTDVLAWIGLAVAITLGGGTTQWRAFLVPAFLILVFGVIRPLFRRLADRLSVTTGSGDWIFSAIVLGLLLCCWTTEWLGVHFIFGAFVWGLALPRSLPVDLPSWSAARLQSVTDFVFLPVFFVVSGMRVDLSAMSVSSLPDLFLIILVAVSGKVGGSFLGAKLARLSFQSGATVAILMNTRGLTELIMLTVGLELHLIDQVLYSMFVIMAIVTTTMTAPLVRLIHPRGLVSRHEAT
jgi:Kef-type K+ transport system membrane component KefB